MDQRKADIIAGVIVDKINGTQLSPTAEEELYRDDHFGTRLDNSTGISTIYAIGSLVRRKSLIDAVSGLISYADIKHHFQTSLSDSRVRGIMFQVDTYGGEAGDCFELADFIREARAEKPIWGVADIDALSAGYALLSSCERCFIAPRGSGGSIGAIIVHCERSRQNEMIGLTYTVLRSAPQKALGTPYEELPQPAIDKYMASLARTGKAFADLVARNRPQLSTDAIIGTEGQWYDAEDAAALNLVDGVRTFDDAFMEFAARLDTGVVPQPPPPAPAPIEPEEIDMTEATGGAPNPATAVPNPAAPNPAAPPAVETAAPVMPGAGQVIPIASAAGASGEVWQRYISDMRETCELAGQPQRLGEFLGLNLSVADARKKLIDERAAAATAAAGHTSTVNPGASAGNGGGNGVLSASLGAFGSLSFDTSTPMTADQAAGWDREFAKTRAMREQSEGSGQPATRR